MERIFNTIEFHTLKVMIEEITIIEITARENSMKLMHSLRVQKNGIQIQRISVCNGKPHRCP